jgi:hypothetical protein
LETNDTYLDECSELRFGAGKCYSKSGNSYNSEQHPHPFRLSGPGDDRQEEFNQLNGKVSDLSLPVPHHINNFGYHYEDASHYPHHSIHQHNLRGELETEYSNSTLYYAIDIDQMQSQDNSSVVGRRRRHSQSSYQDEGEHDNESITWEPEMSKPRGTPRKTKKRDNKNTLGSVGSNDDVLDSKRKRFLERNRLAGINRLIQHPNAARKRSYGCKN